MEGDVKRQGPGGEGVEHVFGEVVRKVLWYVVNVVGIPARLASKNRHSRFGVASRYAGREVEVQELVVKRPVI